MDYPFYIREVAVLTEQERADIQYVQGLQTFSQHPAFGQSLLSSRRTHLPGSLLTRLANIVGLPESAYSGNEFNLLKAGCKIAEHSDIGSQDAQVAWATAHRHKLHIVCSTNPGCYTYHRRGLGDVKVQAHMEEWKVYLYNDYVLHSVENNGISDRVHLLVSFWDKDWQGKHSMMQRYGYRGVSVYHGKT